MRRKGPPPCRKTNIAILLAIFAIGLLVSYILPPACVIFLLAVGLLILGICQIRH